MTATTGTPTGWNYIIWELLASAGYTVTFNANGGTGSLTAEGPYSVATALSLFSTGSMAYTGYAFTGWNTAADGTGTAYADGASFPFTANTTLYAQWVSTGTYAYTANYSGNSVSKINERSVCRSRDSVLGRHGGQALGGICRDQRLRGVERLDPAARRAAQRDGEERRFPRVFARDSARSMPAFLRYFRAAWSAC